MKSNTQTKPLSIAVMGTTGSGKSTFINLVSGSKLPVSNRLASCTQEVCWANTFTLDGRDVKLLDTPGFDDTQRGEVDILKAISKALESHYKTDAKLHGIIYLHRVNDVRMGGASTRSFRLFKKMCGDDSLKNTAIVTTMWDKVTLDEAVPREDELRTEPEFFQPALKQHAKLLRHNNTLESAQKVIRAIFANHPAPLDIQVELVEKHKHISDTTAGRDVESELGRLSQSFTVDIIKLKEELETEMHNEGVAELQAQLEASEKKLAKVTRELEKLKEGYFEQSAFGEAGRRQQIEKVTNIADVTTELASGPMGATEIPSKAPPLARPEKPTEETTPSVVTAVAHEPAPVSEPDTVAKSQPTQVSGEATMIPEGKKSIWQKIKAFCCPCF